MTWGTVEELLRGCTDEQLDQIELALHLLECMLKHVRIMVEHEKMRKERVGTK